MNILVQCIYIYMHFIHFSVNAILQHFCVLALIDNQLTNDLISFKTLLNCIELRLFKSKLHFTQFNFIIPVKCKEYTYM